jgi:hypothetical protein
MNRKALKNWLMPKPYEVPCTVEIAQTPDDFYAHVTLDGGIEVQPGDRVRVEGPPFRIAFGQSLTERRKATIQPAGVLRRAWTRIAARLELTELYEVSFTPGRAR